jgi:toxin-antitoxin system PIN domain toxin
VSFAVDVNVLLYASDRDSAHHAEAVAFLETCAAGTEIIYFTWPTLMGYLRMATHPAIFASPLSPEEAARNVESLLSLPHVRVLAEEDGFWEIYREVASSTIARGNLVPDAHLAALLRQHGVSRIYSRDRDFLKFDFLDVLDPFAVS